MNKIIVILGIVILLLLGGVYLLWNILAGFIVDDFPSPPTTQQQNTETPTGAAGNSLQSTDSAQQVGTKEFTIESQGLKFTPDEIKVNVGDKVRITYKNTLGKHDWVLDEFKARIGLIDAGNTGTVEFVADKRGTFEFYCSVPGHREAGMKGMLIVE